MTGVHGLGLFALAVLVLNATPGVDMMLTASRTLQHGVRAGLATALGISAGCVVHTLAAAFGLAALIAASAAAFAVLKWLGAAYLVWLAVGLLRSATSSPVEVESSGRQFDASAPVGAPTTSGWALFRQGLLTNVLNPKIAIFFLALLPQFIDADAADKTAAFLVLGAIMVGQGTLFLALFVAIVARLRKLRPRPAARRYVEGAGGVVLLGLAARLVFSKGTS